MATVTKLYIASWLDIGTYDCLQEDNPYRDGSLADMASPQGVVMLDREQSTVDAVLAQALQEYLDNWSTDNDEPDPEDLPPTGKWRTLRWQSAKDARRPGDHRGWQEWFWGPTPEDVHVVVSIRDASVFGVLP